MVIGLIARRAEELRSKNAFEGVACPDRVLDRRLEKLPRSETIESDPRETETRAPPDGGPEESPPPQSSPQMDGSERTSDLETERRTRDGNGQ